jgi:hypothetical protein
MAAPASVAAAALLAGFGCGSGGQSSPPGDAGSGSADGAGMCPAPAATADPCATVAAGTIVACSHDGDGQPSQNGYLEIASPAGAPTYVCATSWTPGGSGGYWFDHPEQFMSDPQSCCGGAATPVAAPSAQQPAIGYLGKPHAPRDIKPQESTKPGAGMLRQDPFAVIVRDGSGGAAYASALTQWLGWAGDGKPHPASDGGGAAYYFPQSVLINYTIVETSDGRPIVVLGPEVSLTADDKSPLGHPTLGGCAAGGGAPLVLMAGELAGTTLTNHSGRYGHDASVTEEALATAAKLFNCFGLSVTATTYYPPKP